MNNPLINDVRRVRDEHARKFNYDLAAICADIREHQKTCGHPVVTLKAKTRHKFYPMPQPELLVCQEENTPPNQKAKGASLE